MKGKCPFGKIKCSECVLYRKGIRIIEDGKRHEPFEECAVNIAVDCLENLVGRSIGQQQATEQVRNATIDLGDFFKGIAQQRLLNGNQSRD